MIPFDITLLLDSPNILRGLISGDMVRYGSVIRWAAGTPNAGQIIKHLSETPGIVNELSKLPFFPVSGTANVIGHSMTYHKLLGIDSSLGTINNTLTGMTGTLANVLGVTQIAAGASVLNLGVSVAGFAYMGYKLHQIQKSLGYLQQAMDVGFERVEVRLDHLSRQTMAGFNIVFQSLDQVHQKLDTVSGQLSYLYLLVQDSRKKQESLAKAISNVQKALLIKEIAELQANLKYLSPSSWREVALSASKARLFLSSQALQSSPELDAELMLNTDIAIQGWAVATATEANLLLQVGQHQEARQLLAEETPKLSQIAQQWCRALVHDPQNQTIDTAYLFAAQPFENTIMPERVNRILEISEQDRCLRPDQIRSKQNELAVEFEMSYAPERYSSDWMNQKIATSEYLDSLSELTARLDSLQDFAELCEVTGVQSSHELLPSENIQTGLYLLPSVNELR